MQTLNSTGIFIESSSPKVLQSYADRYPNCNLVLRWRGTSADYVNQVARLASQVPAQRLLVPLTASTPATMQAQAEELSLLGDNIYVLMPTMTAGRFNYALIRLLLTEGVPVAVTGLVTRQMVDSLLTGLASETSLLLMMDQATAYYDLIVSAAITKIYPQAQLVFKVTQLPAILTTLQLSLDGLLLSAPLFDLYQELTRMPHGAACRLADRQLQVLAN